MIAQSTQEPLFAPIQRPISADRVSKGGRVATLVMFTVMLALAGTMFYWLGARRVNNFFVSKADSSFEAHQYQEAVDRYTWALRFDRSDAHSYLNRGYSLQELKDDTNALPEFTHYIDLRPDDAAGYFARGASYARLGNNEQAVSDFSAAISRDPNHANALASRARAQAALGRWLPAGGPPLPTLPVHP